MERRKTNDRLRILVADDDHDTVDMLADILRDEGHVVYTAHCGNDALGAVQVFRPDAIILDVNLPQVSGYALAQATRAGFDDVRQPLLIAISGEWTHTADRIVAQRAGIDHYLTKPADPGDVLALLDVFRRRSL
jgi:DNA-binding response OmpR family regulator